MAIRPDPTVPPYNPYPYAQPQVIMMPYTPPTQASAPSDSMRLLEKMMELKSDENKKLLEILLE
jgi:hypothetical protein